MKHTYRAIVRVLDVENLVFAWDIKAETKEDAINHIDLLAPWELVSIEVA